MTEYIIGFSVGFALSWFWTYVLALGSAINVINGLQRSCASLFIISEEGLQEIMELKYIAMKEAKRSEQNIKAQRHIDKMNIDSVKKSIMRNYLLSYPQQYSHVMRYSTWEEMQQFVDNVIGERRNNHD
jgi:hypothetical protein